MSVKRALVHHAGGGFDELPELGSISDLICQRDQVVWLRGERAGALRVLHEDGKHRVCELGPVVLDAWAQVGLRQRIALRRL